jgi:hypothetical protein
MLDLAAHVTRRSRLACQIWLTEELETLTVHIPRTSTICRDDKAENDLRLQRD